MRFVSKLFVVFAMILGLASSGYGKTITLDPAKTLKVIGVVGMDILKKADELEALASKNKEVTIVINSPGGAVVPGLFFIDRMEMVKERGTKLTCVVTTLAASMAMHILAHCDTRYAFNNTMLLWHPMRQGGLMFSVTQYEAKYLAETMAMLENPMNEYLKDQLGLSDEIFWKHYNFESLLPAWWVSSQTNGFIEVVSDVTGVKDIFAFNDPNADKLYKQLIQNSPGIPEINNNKE